jgi:CheY-like chemotaxis protein
LGETIWPTEIDTGDLEDAILNLVINAGDAMPEGGRLVIETSNAGLNEGHAAGHPRVAPGDYVLLAVSDTGTGMSKKVKEQVFEPFFTTKEGDKGTGLGMSMVYSFVKRSQGHIQIDSKPGRGTTVRIYLPRAVEMAETAYAGEKPEVMTPRGDETILVVEDEAELLGLAEDYLGELGYRTIRAKDGREALAILQQEEEIHLLFSDVVMPGGISGHALAHRAIELRPELKVLLTSGFSKNLAAEDQPDGLAAEVLPKPYGLTDVAQRVRQALDGKG